MNALISFVLAGPEPLQRRGQSPHPGPRYPRRSGRREDQPVGGVRLVRGKMQTELARRALLVAHRRRFQGCHFRGIILSFYRG